MASDAVTLIKNDHRVMERLFERMRTEKKQRAALVKECIARLSAHSWAEEEKVYPVLVQADPPERGEVYHGVEEHHEAEQLLHKLEEADPNSDRFEAVLSELTEAVLHHVEEEETKILPALAESVDQARLVQLGADFEERRMAVLTEHGFGDAGTRSEGSEDLTRDELYERAKAADVPGRSSMTKQELADAVRDER
ncbi:hemerythrin domain-containing protein [Phytohabitans sp. LJ34]|uniref:hemerythrin domain-containing protein n=1 Tax=Phytohabitans sp. LJ34 TaxID=3452217 RepID=UPI003F8C8193